MNDNDRTSEQLTAGLVDLVGTSAPDYRNDILRQVARTRQRPAWTFPERWTPMALVTHRARTGPPLRSAWTMLLVGLLTLALVAGLIVAGSLLLRRGPDDKLLAALMVPTLEADTTWEASRIAGLSIPSGMDLGPDGNLYVVNAGTSEVLVISPDGALVRRWGTKGTGPGQFDFLRDPTGPQYSWGGVAVASDGSVYVSDTVNDRVQQFDAAGGFIREWGAFGPDDGQFLEPIDIAVGPDGTVYVVDDQRDDIQQFDPAGGYLRTIGSHGTGDGQMNFTGSVILDGEGTLYNADFNNHRFQAWGPDGVFRWSLGSEGTGPGQFFQPRDVGIDADGNIYAGDAMQIQVFGPDRQLLSVWDAPSGTSSDGLGALVVAADGTVYVSDPRGPSIHRMRIMDRASAISESPSGSQPPGPVAAASSPASTPAAPVPVASPRRLSVDTVFAVPFTIDLPPTWQRNWLYPNGVEMQLPDSPSNAGFIGVFVPTNAFQDPCKSGAGPMAPAVGPSVDDLTQALTHMVGFRASPVQPITIDGFQGTTFDLEHSIDATKCDDSPWLPQWTYDGGATRACEQVRQSGAEAECYSGPSTGFHQRIAILDVRGTRVLINTWTFGNTTRDQLIEINRVFDSIDFQ